MLIPAKGTQAASDPKQGLLVKPGAKGRGGMAPKGVPKGGGALGDLFAGGFVPNPGALRGGKGRGK